jgi:predicted MFS family arabinose efflux permease
MISIRSRFAVPGSTRDASVLLESRAVRAAGDGLVSVLLAAYLAAVGLSGTEIGVVVAATMLGSAALTLGIGIGAPTYPRRRVLQMMSLLMIATGFGAAAFTSFWPLTIVGFLGTINPSGGDVSAFQPTEQAALPATTDTTWRTALLARYSLIGTLFAAVGAALAGIPEWASHRTGLSLIDAIRWAFLAYAGLGAVMLLRYRHLSPAVDVAATPRRGLGASKRTVYRLAALFSLDSFGGGFVITAIVVLWLHRRFDLSLAGSGAVFFWAGILAAWSQLLAPLLARRIGLIRTMSFTHLPANGFLILAAFMPSAPLAIACLLARAALSQMDVPARISYVMAVVTPDERPAAASITNVPRSLVAALPPVAAGWLLSLTDFGWPLVIGGATKITYDLLLLKQFRDHRPPEERPTVSDRGAR